MPVGSQIFLEFVLPEFPRDVLALITPGLGMGLEGLFGTFRVLVMAPNALL